MRRLPKVLSALVFFGGVAALRADTAAPPAPPPMSTADMTAKAAALEARIQADNRHILSLKEQTKKQKDVIKLTCVNDKIVQLKAQMNLADTANDSLQISIAKNSDDRQDLFNQLAAAADAVKQLREAAAACVGEPELYKQEAGVDVTRPIIPDDPGVNPMGNEVEAPGYASPFR